MNSGKLRVFICIVTAGFLAACGSSNSGVKCDGNATCNNHGRCDTPGGQIVCICDTGFGGDRCEKCADGYKNVSGACVQMTSCAEEGSCPTEHKSVCDDSSGHVTCSCDQGYTEVNSACKSVCEQSNPCTDSHKTQCSIGNSGAVVCACDPGYKSQGKDCVQMASCDPNPCTDPNKTQCSKDLAGNVVCSCDPGYKDNGNGGCESKCVDPNPCIDSHKTKCSTDTQGNIACSCDVGYQLDASNKCMVFEYQCSGTGCGASATPQQRECSDNTDTLCSAWTTVATGVCNSSQVCWANSTGAGCTTCDLGCISGECNGCNPNLGKPCCNTDGTIKDITNICNSGTNYKCSGTACGNDLLSQNWQQYCNGKVDECQGTVVNLSDFVLNKDCTIDQLCDATNLRCNLSTSCQSANGKVCNSDDDCLSGHCVTGVVNSGQKVCCSSACTGNCQLCDANGQVGTCITADSLCTGDCDACDVISGNCKAADTDLCPAAVGTLCTTCDKISATNFSCTFDNTLNSDCTSLYSNKSAVCYSKTECRLIRGATCSTTSGPTCIDGAGYCIFNRCLYEGWGINTYCDRGGSDGWGEVYAQVKNGVFQIRATVSATPFTDIDSGWQNESTVSVSDCGSAGGCAYTVATMSSDGLYIYDYWINNPNNGGSTVFKCDFGPTWSGW